MNVRMFFSKDNDTALFMGALMLSLFFHGLIFTSGRVSLDVFSTSRRTVEIDLTHSARIGGLAKQAKTLRAAVPKVKPQEWVVPKKGSVLEQAAVPGSAQVTEESDSRTSGVAADFRGAEYEGASGFGDGYADVTQVSRYPQLLNLGELQKNLQRFYPEYERIKRNEGTVTLLLRIDADGKVVSAEVLKAASPAFGEAAKKVTLLLKFKPAMVGRNKVAVQLRQTIAFKLEE